MKGAAAAADDDGMSSQFELTVFDDTVNDVAPCGFRFVKREWLANPRSLIELVCCEPAFFTSLARIARFVGESMEELALVLMHSRATRPQIRTFLLLQRRPRPGAPSTSRAQRVATAAAPHPVRLTISEGALYAATPSDSASIENCMQSGRPLLPLDVSDFEDDFFFGVAPLRRILVVEEDWREIRFAKEVAVEIFSPRRPRRRRQQSRRVGASPSAAKSKHDRGEEEEKEKKKEKEKGKEKEKVSRSRVAVVASAMPGRKRSTANDDNAAAGSSGGGGGGVSTAPDGDGRRGRRRLRSRPENGKRIEALRKSLHLLKVGKTAAEFAGQDGF